MGFGIQISYYGRIRLANSMQGVTGWGDVILALASTPLTHTTSSPSLSHTWSPSNINVSKFHCLATKHQLQSNMTLSSNVMWKNTARAGSMSVLTESRVPVFLWSRLWSLTTVGLWDELSFRCLRLALHRCLILSSSHLNLADSNTSGRKYLRIFFNYSPSWRKPRQWYSRFG